MKHSLLLTAPLTARVAALYVAELWIAPAS